jgi:hypothetical protein
MCYQFQALTTQCNGTVLEGRRDMSKISESGQRVETTNAFPAVKSKGGRVYFLFERTEDGLTVQVTVLQKDEFCENSFPIWMVGKIDLEVNAPWDENNPFALLSRQLGTTKRGLGLVIKSRAPV